MTARKVYERYLEIGQRVSESGGDGVEGFKPFLTASAYSEEVQGAALLKSEKLISTGVTRLDRFVLQDADLRTGDVSAYACIDLSDVRTVNAAGKEVTPSSRPDRQTFRPIFRWSAGRLLMEENSTWSGASVC